MEKSLHICHRKLPLDEASNGDEFFVLTDPGNLHRKLDRISFSTKPTIKMHIVNLKLKIKNSPVAVLTVLRGAGYWSDW